MKGKKLYISKKNKMIFGICGGFAEYLDMDPTVVRTIYLILDIMTGFVPLALAYFILAFVIPENPLEM